MRCKGEMSAHRHSPHSHRHAKQMHLFIYLFIPPSFTCWKRSLGNIGAFTKLPIQTFCSCARICLPTIAFCFSSPQGNSLRHPQRALQVWCHPGELHLLLLRRDNQGGSHPSGLLRSGWGRPAGSAPARDSRTGPDVSNRGRGGLWGVGADAEEEQKTAMSGKPKTLILYCSVGTSKQDGRGEEEQRTTHRDLNKTIVPDLIAATTGACSPHTPLAELGFHPACAESPLCPCPSPCKDTRGRQRLRARVEDRQQDRPDPPASAQPSSCAQTHRASREGR